MKKQILSSILIIELALIILGIVKTPSWGDEKNFHLPLVENINCEIIIKADSNYSSAYTPLPYVIGNFVYRINKSIITLRILNSIVFILSIFIAYKLFLKIDKQMALSLTVLYSLNPYLLRAGYIYLMSNYGILFALIGIYTYLYFKGQKRLWISHISWMLSVLSMQWMLMVYVAFIIYEFEQLVLERHGYIIFIKLLIIKIISLAPVLFLINQWNGLTHPNFHAHTLKASLPHLNAILAIMGFWFFFFIINNIKNINWGILKVLIFLSPILLINLPLHSNHHGINVITGIVSSFCKKVEILIGFPYPISTGILMITGLIGIILLWKMNNKKEMYYLYVAVGLMTAFTVSTRLGASHIFIMIPFLILAMQKLLIKQKVVLNLLIFQAFFITAVYNFYIIFMRSQGSYFIK